MVDIYGNKPVGEAEGHLSNSGYIIIF